MNPDRQAGDDRPHDAVHSAGNQIVAGNIERHMLRNGVGKSDLARELFGAEEDSGKAKGRATVSRWLNGTRRPGSENMVRIAQVLGTTVEELQYGVAEDSKVAELNLTALKDRPGMALLYVNKVVPFQTAAKIASMLADEGGE